MTNQPPLPHPKAAKKRKKKLKKYKKTDGRCFLSEPNQAQKCICSRRVDGRAIDDKRIGTRIYYTGNHPDNR